MDSDRKAIEEPAAENAIFGWFDDADQTVPTSSPPLDAPCLFCGARITPDDVRTHSFRMLSQYAGRSYFFRTHRTCAQSSAVDEADVFERVFAMVRVARK
jgi:hypothetical protein